MLMCYGVKPFENNWKTESCEVQTSQIFNWATGLWL